MKCIKCNQKLDSSNWSDGQRKAYVNVCRNCRKKEQAKYRLKHQEELKIKNLQWYYKNQEYRRKWAHDKRRRLKSEIFELLGNKCCQCGENDFRCLQIDHVHGNGNKERKENNNTPLTLYKLYLSKIKAGSNDYQLLCANCNLRKRFENQEWANGLIEVD